MVPEQEPTVGVIVYTAVPFPVNVAEIDVPLPATPPETPVCVGAPQL